MEKVRKLIIDPPEGWKYGFPKEIPEDAGVRDFLIENGYPEKLLDLAMKYSRFIYEEYYE